MSLAEPTTNGVTAGQPDADAGTDRGVLDALLPVLDAASTTLLVTDVDLTVVHVNAHGRETLGALATELRAGFGVDVDGLTGGSLHRLHRDPTAVEAALTAPGARFDGVLELGAQRFAYRIAPVVGADGARVGHVATLEPVVVDAGSELAENAQAITRVLEVLGTATTRDEVARLALDTVRQAFGWDYGSYWVREAGDGDLVFAVESGSVNEEFRQVTLASSFAYGVGLSGRTWKNRELTFERDLGTVTDCVRAPAARTAGVRSGVCFPVVVDDEVVGTMDFFALETLELSPERLAALRSVGRSVSSAMERFVRGERALEVAQNAEATSRVLEVLATSTSTDEAARAALDAVRDAFGWDYGSYWVREDGDGDLVFAVESGSVNEEFRQVTLASSFAHGVGLSGRTWKNRELTFERDLGTVTDCVRAPAARSAGVRSGVCFPVVVHDQVVGTMDFFALRTLSLSEERLAALRGVGHAVSEVMERFADADATREQAENAMAVSQVLEVLGAARNMDEAARSALDTVREAFGWDYGSYWVREDGYGDLVFNVESGNVTREFREVTLEASFAYGVGLSGRTWKNRELTFERDLGEVTDCVRAPAARSAGVKSGVCFPIVVDDEVVGTMDFFALETLELSEERLSALASVGQSVSTAMERFMRANEMARVQSMMENAPTNMMFADKNLVLQYMNPKSLETLRSIEAYLPCKADEVVGQSIDIFHENPVHQRGILGNPEEHLPMRSNIQVGPETLDLLVSPIRDKDGTYIGAMASWEVITEKLRLEREMARVQSMMENAPTNMMFADPDLTLRYMNPASMETLRTLEEFLPCKADEIIGQSIDIFHKNPAHQRGILGNPEDHLPMRSNIQVGPETLDLLVSPIRDNDGTYIGAMASWEVITEKLRLERETQEAAERERAAAEELRAKVDAMLEVVEAAAAGDLTREVEVRGEDAIGQMGEGLQRLLSDLRTSIAGIARSVGTLTEAANDLTDVSTTMEGNASETSDQANLASEASRGVASNVETVAAAAEEMSVSIREISQNTSHAVQVARDAVTAADATTETINKLGDSSAEIGKIIKVITDIAQQTNLLALNATIEAARAGESGKGFAVVASEVKELATQTARATEDISEKIETIQTDTTSAVQAITEISSIIDSISEIQTTIASAVEEQAATTSEISRSVQEANAGSAEITDNIARVAEAATHTSDGAAQTQERAEGLTRTASELNTLVERFRY